MDNESQYIWAKEEKELFFNLSEQFFMGILGSYYKNTVRLNVLIRYDVKYILYFKS